MQHEKVKYRDKQRNGENVAVHFAAMFLTQKEFLESTRKQQKSPQKGGERKYMDINKIKS